MLSLMEKRYLAQGHIDVLSTMGVQITHYPVASSIQEKNGKIRLTWDETSPTNTWGSISSNSYTDYTIGNVGENRTENKISFLKSDFSTFSISPLPKDALDVTVSGVTTRYVIIGPDTGADFPEMFYVANVDSLEHINP